MKYGALALLWMSRWLPMTLGMRWQFFRWSLQIAPHVTPQERERALQWWDAQRRYFGYRVEEGKDTMQAIICPNCNGGGVLWDDVDRRNETCFLCDGFGHVDAETFDAVDLNPHGPECGCELCIQDYDMA